MDLKEDFKGIQILHLALVLGQVMIAIILIFIHGANSNSQDDLVLVSVAGFISVATMLFAPMIYNKVLEQRREEGKNGDLMSKFTDYRATKIIRWGLLEGGNLILIIIYFLTGNTLLLPLFVVSLGMLLMARPTAENFADDFKLNAQEASELRKATR